MFQASIDGTTGVPVSLTSGSALPARGQRREADPPGQLRAEALAETAPWLAGLSAICALTVLWALSHAVPPVGLGAWAALIVAVNWVTVRARRRAAQYGAGRMRSTVWVVVEAAAQAGLWATLPAFALATVGAGTQLLLAGAIVAMMAGAVLLAVAPVAAATWVAVLGAAAVFGLGHDEHEVPLELMPLLAAYVGVILVGCLAIERLLSTHTGLAARERVRAESVGMLLREYEEQGIGWLWQIDPANALTYVSPRAHALLGHASGALLGRSLPMVLGCAPELGQMLAAREAFAGLEMEVETPLGQRVLSISASPMRGPRGEHEGFRGVAADVTDNRLSERRLTEAARRDVLTGLPNRQYMRELFVGAIAEAQAGAQPCAIMFLDLDGFKAVNDNFGHSIGDAVLRETAERLRTVVGAEGRVGRLGGDEFAVLLSDGSNRRGVEQIGQQLIATVAEPYRYDQIEARIGTSIGCATAPVDGVIVEELLRKADLALYHAKELGRGTFFHYQPQLQDAVDDRLRLEQDLRDALRREQLALYYQPIVGADTQEVVGFEALLRWHHPERGIIQPADFIGLAEETGLIADIGNWVMAQACRDAMMWPEHLIVSVNLSPRQLVIPALPNSVSEALARSRMAPNRLELEVTESVFMSDSDGSVDVLRRVRALGVGIALDDFGTGYSSLGYLNKAIFHTLKIDGSFVRDAASRSETVAIIEAIVALARSFRMTIIAEGVETPDDAQRMRALGCHRLQGFLYGQPMPHEYTVALVGTRWEPRRLPNASDRAA